MRIGIVLTGHNFMKSKTHMLHIRRLRLANARFCPIAGASIADVGIVKYSLTPVYTANAPTVPNAVMVEIESFDPPDVISGSVRIDAAALLYGLNFQPAAISTGAVDIATATFSHDYQLVGTT